MAIIATLNFDAATEGANLAPSAPWALAGGGSVPTTVSAAAYGGSGKGCRWASTAAYGFVSYDFGSALTTARVIAFRFRVNTWASAHMYLGNAGVSAGSAFVEGDFRINNTTRYLAIRNGTTAAATGTTAIVSGTWYQAMWKVDPATDTQELRVYEDGNPTAHTTLTGAWASNTARLLGFGPTAAAAGGAIDFDDVQVADDWPAAPNNPPTVTAGAAQTVTAGATVNLAFTATDTDGTIASRATTFDYPSSGAPSITGGGTATPSFTAGSAPARYVVRQTVTDDDGATSFATTEVRVPVSGGTTVRPEPGAGTGVGTWTIGGGSASHGAALADDSNATWVESGALSGTEQTLRKRWHPSQAKANPVVENILGVDTGTGSATVRLYEGAVLRQSWTHALTATPTAFSDALSPGTISAISDWGDLFIEVGVTS